MPYSGDELEAWCRNSDLANFKRPRAYVFVQAIPKSPVGKILRRLLVAGDYQPERGGPDVPVSHAGTTVTEETS